jgi:hypothetical protein
MKGTAVGSKVPVNVPWPLTELEKLQVAAPPSIVQSITSKYAVPVA